MAHTDNHWARSLHLKWAVHLIASTMFLLPQVRTTASPRKGATPAVNVSILKLIQLFSHHLSQDSRHIVKMGPADAHLLKTIYVYPQ